MASRRDVLIGGGSGLAALGLGLAPAGIAAAAPSAARAAPPLFLVDRTIAPEVGPAAERLGSAAISYSGDIGMPWLDRIEPLWRRYPQAVAGVTYGGAFFCLERLARSYGLACTFRSCPPLPGSGQLVGTGAEEVAAALLTASARSGWPRAANPAAGEAADRPLAWLLQPAGNHQPRGN